MSDDGVNQSSYTGNDRTPFPLTFDNLYDWIDELRRNVAKFGRISKCILDENTQRGGAPVLPAEGATKEDREEYRAEKKDWEKSNYKLYASVSRKVVSAMRTRYSKEYDQVINDIDALSLSIFC